MIAMITLLGDEINKDDDENDEDINDRYVQNYVDDEEEEDK